MLLHHYVTIYSKQQGIITIIRSIIKRGDHQRGIKVVTTAVKEAGQINGMMKIMIIKSNQEKDG